MSNFVIPTLLLMDGLVFALPAFFAHELGLDPNTTWGNTRYILMASGTVLGLVSLLLILPKKRRLIPFESIIRSETSKTVFLLGHLWTIVFVIYAWFITYGTFTKWDHTSNYYAQLADAFNHKHLYLETKPSEAILATPDPYNPIDRPWQEGVWDMSLYAGRFYLYWGPVPALLIAPIQSCFDVNIRDIYIDFFFYAGLVIINSLILWKEALPGGIILDLFSGFESH